MKVVKKDSGRERTVLTAMITDKQVLASIAPKWTKEGLFPSEWSNLVGGWAVKYFNKYGKPPGKSIKSIFMDWGEDNPNTETVENVERCISYLSNEYDSSEKINSPFLIDLAGKYFQSVQADALLEELQKLKEVGKVKDFFKTVDKFNRIEIGTGTSRKLMQDEALWTRAFEHERESLVKYPGDLGRFFGNELERDGFIAIMGVQKRGKSVWLQDLAVRAMEQRRRVAYFQCGDLSEIQQVRRFGVRIARHPLKATRKDFPLSFPKKLELAEGIGEKVKIIEAVEKHFEEGLTRDLAWNSVKQFMANKVRSTKPYLMLSVHPMKSITVAGIHSTLVTYQHEGWIPDVIVIDYADILANPVGFQGQGDFRDAINENWMAMRRLSQVWHCLVVTATQVKASGFTAETLGMEHFSEDNRKFSHVTGMMALNQNNSMKEQGIVALNWIVLREDDFSISRKVYCAGNMAVMNPAIRSIM